MPQVVCSSILKAAPAAGCLLVYLEEAVLTRHCLQRQPMTKIGAALGLTRAEVRRLHDRACLRLSLAVSRLMADIEVERLGVPPTTLLQQLWQAASSRPAQPPRRGRSPAFPPSRRLARAA